MTDSDDRPGVAAEPSAGWGRVEVHPGPGIVHRGDDVLLVVPVVDQPRVQSVAGLLQCCGLGPDPTGARRVRQAAWLVAQAETDAMPAFALLVRATEQLVVMAHGAVTVTVTGPQDTSFSGRESLAWVERNVDQSYETLTVTEEGKPVRAADPALGLDLLAGTVHGAGVTLRRPAQPPPPGRSAAPLTQVQPPADGHAPTGVQAPAEVRAPADVQVSATASHTVIRPVSSFRTVSLASPPGGGRKAARPPLPLGVTPTAQRPPAEVLVEGVVCRCGHFNEPELTSCEACGATIGKDTRRDSRPRPPLGVLVTDDGSVYTVAGDYVIGREPEQAADVRSGRSQPLVMKDPEHSTSRVHARVHLEGWEVLVSDGGSSNGTFVSRGGATGPWSAVAREPGTRLRPGDRVRLGKRQLLFDRYPGRLTP